MTGIFGKREKTHPEKISTDVEFSIAESPQLRLNQSRYQTSFLIMKQNYFSRTIAPVALSLAAFTGFAAPTKPLPSPKEEPKIIQAEPGKPPSDAVVLFDGSDLSKWGDMKGGETKWKIVNGAMESVKGAGYIRTKDSYGDCQLHIEWATPSKVEGSDQGRGNSGVFFGGTRYELQVLDSYDNKTYFHGQASAIYKQHAPLVNASRKPGEWQTYDVIYHAPRFDEDGKLKKAGTFTVFHNGVLTQDHVEILGNTGHGEAPRDQKHPEKQPLALQDHGNPVRVRNIWIRELPQHHALTHEEYLKMD